MILFVIQTLNDTQLEVSAPVDHVEEQLAQFEERRRMVNDLWDTWRLNSALARELSTQWDMYSHDANKVSSRVQ